MFSAITHDAPPPPPAKKYTDSHVTLPLSSPQGPGLQHRLGQPAHHPQLVPTQENQKQRSHRQNHHPGHHPGPAGPQTPARTLRTTTEGLYSCPDLDERIFYENPNITQEELEKIMAQYDQYRGAVPSRSSKQESGVEGERRVPIRPR